MTQQIIPLSINTAESLVRGIVHPLFYSDSKRKLKPEALLPPPNRADVSVLRLQYTTAPFCKQHCQGLRIGESLYVGMAVLRAQAVAEANQLPEAAGQVTVVATPLDTNEQPVTASIVTTTDAGLPMHADILYSQPNERGTPNQANRLVARHLLGRTCYYADPAPTQAGWSGDNLEPPRQEAA